LWKDIIQKYDVNEDGKISFEEFLRMIKLLEKK